MKNRGVFFMLLATLFFALMNVLIKWVPRIGAVEIVFFRSVVSFAISFVILKQKNISVWGNNKKWLIIRGVAGSAGLLFFFATIKNMPLGSAVAIHYMSPIFTSLLGVFIVRESVRPLQWVFFAIALSGALFIHGFDPRVTTSQVILGLLGALAAGLAYNSIRKLSTGEHPLVIIFYFPLVTIPITSIYLLYNWTMPTLFELLILLSIGITTQFAQYFMTMAYQSDELSKISSIQYIGLVFAVFFGYVLFDETYNLQSGLGILVIIAGVILNVWYKNRLSSLAEYPK